MNLGYVLREASGSVSVAKGTQGAVWVGHGAHEQGAPILCFVLHDCPMMTVKGILGKPLQRLHTILPAVSSNCARTWLTGRSSAANKQVPGFTSLRLVGFLFPCHVARELAE